MVGSASDIRILVALPLRPNPMYWLVLQEMAVITNMTIHYESQKVVKRSIQEGKWCHILETTSAILLYLCVILQATNKMANYNHMPFIAPALSTCLQKPLGCNSLTLHQEIGNHTAWISLLSCPCQHSKTDGGSREGGCSCQIQRMVWLEKQV